MSDQNVNPLVKGTQEIISAVPQFNPNKKLGRSEKRNLLKKQWDGISMQFINGNLVIPESGIFIDNTENLKDALISFFYTDLPSGWQDDEELVAKLYEPIEKLDPLNTKKVQGTKTH